MLLILHQACLLGSNLTLPICDGRVTLGTWQVTTLPIPKIPQGVWLCEHRDRAGPRKVLVTVNGVIRDPIRWFSAFIGTAILFRRYFINNCSPIYRLYPTASK